MIENAFLQFCAQQLPTVNLGAGVLPVRYFFESAPQGETNPLVVFSLNTRDEDWPKGSPGIIYSQFDVMAYRPAADEAATLGEAFKAAVNNYVGTMFGYTITLMRITDTYDGYESQTELFFRNFTLQLNHMRQ